MRILKISLLIALLIVSMLFADLSSEGMNTVSAHPGNTDARGGHTCRTNCSKWGLKKGQYHKHGVKKVAAKRKARPPKKVVTKTNITPTKSSKVVTPVKYQCNCRKTCTEIFTCAEAQYQLKTCGCSVRDADHDGIACDAMCQ